MAIRDTLALTGDQRALRDTVRDFLAGQLPSASLRGMMGTGPGYSPELHARLAGELGLTGLTVPGEFGGLGLGPAEACVVHTELGRVLYPGPLLASRLAAEALLAVGDHAATDGQTAAGRWLPLLAAGSVNGAIAAADKNGLWSAEPGPIRAHLTPPRLAAVRPLLVRRRGARGGHHRGVGPGRLGARDVPGGGGSAGTAVLRAAGPGPDPAGVRHLLRGHPGHPAQPGQGRGRRAGPGRARPPARHRRRSRGRHRLVPRRGLRLRQEPGAAAGSFREIARACVDMLAVFQAAEAAVRHAAVAAADGVAEAPAAARAAALQAGQAYREVTEAAIRLFGGIGPARKHDALLYYRRAWSAERLSGVLSPAARPPR